MPHAKRIATLLMLAGAAACADGRTPLGPSSSTDRSAADAASATIYDGGHTTAGYNMKFFFLSPMVENFNDDKKATDGTLSPVVEICVLTSAGVCGTLLDRFTTTSGGKTNEKVRWLGSHYQVNFKSGSYKLDSSKKYRVTVLVNGLVMGYADAVFARDNDNHGNSGHGGGSCRDGDRSNGSGARYHSSSSNGHGSYGDDDDDDDHHDGHNDHDEDNDHHDGHNNGHDGHNGHDDDDDDCGGSSAQQYVTLSCNQTLPIKFRIGFGVAAGIRLTPPTQTVNKGATAQYVAAVTDFHNKPVTVPIIWTSSDSTIAKVSSTGLVTTFKAGTVTITAKAERVSATATLIVKQAGVVRVDVTSVTMGVGGMRTLVANAYDAAGNLVVGQPVTWSIRNADGTIAQITSTSGVATGLTPGVAQATATVAGVSGTGTATVTSNLEFNSICNGSGLALFGVTTILADSPCGIRLTPSETWTSGAAWSTVKQQVAGGFEVHFAMRMSDGGPPDLLVAGNTDPGADGLVFVIQNMSQTALGGQGIGLGYQGMTSSLGVEFDTFLNPGEGDPSGNHVSIHTGGLGANNADESFSIGAAVIPGNLYDNQVHQVVIKYVPGTITVSLDGVVILTAPLTLTNIGGNSILDAQGKAWAGFTSATGAAFGTHDILSWQMTTTAP